MFGFNRKRRPKVDLGPSNLSFPGDEDLRRLEEGISATFAERAERFSWAALLLKLLVAGGAFAIAVAQCATLPAQPWEMWPVIGTGAAIIVFLFSLLLIAVDPDPSKELNRARDALQIAGRNIRAIQGFTALRSSMVRQAELQEAYRLMVACLERAIPMSGSDELLAEQLLLAADRSLLIAMSFQLTHHYTFCVYVREPTGAPGKHQLRLVAHRRTIECEVTKARKWEEGIGTVGMCALRKSDITVPDSHAVQLGSVYDLHPMNDEDRERYRSIFATPILVGPASDLWGVVVATSDEPHHFGSDSICSQSVKALASMMALGIVGRRGTPGPTSTAQSSQSPTTSGPSAPRAARRPRSRQNP